MISFFRINDPFRIIVLFVLLLLVRLPYYIHGITLTLPELNHLLVGESLANGATLYVSLWEDISPLSAWIYMLIDYVFGKSTWVYHILGFFLMFYQSILFNAITYKNKLYNEGTYVPALIYGILMSLSSDMYPLSPILMSSTFILLAMNNIFRQVEFRIKADEPIFYIGVYLGIATLFYFPSAIFGGIALIILAFFSSTIGRRYLLVVYGFLLPLFLVISYFYIIDGASAAWTVFSTKVFSPNKIDYLSYQTVLYITAPVVLFFIIGIFRVFKRNRFSNYQLRLIQLVIVWLLLSFGLLFWMEKLISSYIIFVPTIAVIITHYFLLIKKSFKTELIFMFFLTAILYVNMALIFNWLGIQKQIDRSHTMVLNTPYEKFVKDKKVVVLGNNLSIYRNASLATPFIDWGLASETLLQPNYYGKATMIHKGFVENPPEIIIDLENIMPQLKESIVFIDKNYNKIEKGVYKLKEDLSSK